MQSVIDIAKKLGITEFIESLPNGFETYLGENGATLSGGQRQRIAIARALYRKPEILILDEATTSLDSKSEQFVQEAINYPKEMNKTVIVIAHRLSTIYNADKIIVLDSGKVIEEGKHSELILQQSYYYDLWKHSFPLEVNYLVLKDLN